MEAEEIKYKNVNVPFSMLRISTTLYHIYQLLYYIGHIQMTSKYYTIEVEVEEIDYNNEKSHSIYLGSLLHYITLSKYYIVQEIFR